MSFQCLVWPWTKSHAAKIGILQSHFIARALHKEGRQGESRQAYWQRRARAGKRLPCFRGYGVNSAHGWGIWIVTLVAWSPSSCDPKMTSGCANKELLGVKLQHLVIVCRPYSNKNRSSGHCKRHRGSIKRPQKEGRQKHT